MRIGKYVFLWVIWLFWFLLGSELFYAIIFQQRVDIFFNDIEENIGIDAAKGNRCSFPTK